MSNQQETVNHSSGQWNLGQGALMLLLLGLPALAIVSDLGSGPMRAFTVLPYLFANPGLLLDRFNSHGDGHQYAVPAVAEYRHFP